MTEKLYYIDSHMKEFEATVLECFQDKKCWKIVLDRTAFFPEGGGQCADTGYLNDVRITDVHEKDGVIFHYAEREIPAGSTVAGHLDWEQRFSNMQQHSGEHIISGLVHRTFGYDNIGFHLGRENVTMDFNGTFAEGELEDIETRANVVVWSDLDIRVEFPDAETLKTLEYRSKIELENDVRIVTIPGADVCACCAPHVSRTGEIGLIRIVDVQHYKGGTRVSILCGDRALRDYRKKQDNVYRISVALSAKQEQTADAVLKQKEELTAMKEAYARAMGELIVYRAEAVAETEGTICLFEGNSDAKALRELVNLLTPKAGKAAAVFSGDDVNGYRYIIGSKNMDVRTISKDMNGKLNGRGGGSKEMVQGTVFASEQAIKEYMNGI